MRLGTLSKLGLGYEILKELNPKIVFCTLSGYGATGPYQNMPSHGIAYDTWAGLITPAVDEEGFTHSKRYAKCGYKCWSDAGCFALLAGITRARETGMGCQMELAQSDAAAYMDWYRIETWRAYERSEDEVTGNPSDDYERRPPGLAGMWEGVDTRFMHLAMAMFYLWLQNKLLEELCDGVSRMDLFSKNGPVQNMQIMLKETPSSKRTSKYL